MIVTNPPEVLDDGDQRKNEKALASIILALEDSQLIHVRCLQSVKEGWEALRSVYMTETACSKVLLSRRLYKAQLKPGKCMSTPLQNMRRKFLELEERGMTFTEAHKRWNRNGWRGGQERDESAFSTEQHLQRSRMVRCCPERRNRGAVRQGHRTNQHMWSGSPTSFSLGTSMTEHTRNTWLLDSG
ncbi:hypothetical protein E2320_010581 [Naja naja]|nr:hypothetical protein E2320_010581 [Naja naja]